MTRMRLALLVGLLTGLAISVPTVWAQGPFSAQIQRLLNSSSTWGGTQTFTNVTVTGTCTGCGGGGGVPGGAASSIQYNNASAFGGFGNWDGTATFSGQTTANGALRLQGTNNATRTTSYLTLQENGGLVGLAGIATPAYKLEIGGNGNTAAALHVANTTTDVGLYGAALGGGGAWLGFESAYNGANWVAKNARAGMLANNAADGVWRFYADTGLTPTNTYSPTERFQIFPNAVVIASGFGSSPAVVGTFLTGFRITVGTGGVATTGSITLPTAPNGWSCRLQDQSTVADVTNQTNNTVTSASFTSTIAWGAADILVGSCFPF